MFSWTDLVLFFLLMHTCLKGLTWTNKMIKQEKEKHHKAVKVLNKLLETLKMYDNIDSQSRGNPTGDTNQIYKGRDDIKSTQTFNDSKSKVEMFIYVHIYIYIMIARRIHY